MYKIGSKSIKIVDKIINQPFDHTYHHQIIMIIRGHNNINCHVRSVRAHQKHQQSSCEHDGGALG